jgi:hypothetical protein
MIMYWQCSGNIQTMQVTASIIYTQTLLKFCSLCSPFSNSLTKHNLHARIWYDISLGKDILWPLHIRIFKLEIISSKKLAHKKLDLCIKIRIRTFEYLYFSRRKQQDLPQLQQRIDQGMHVFHVQN